MPGRTTSSAPWHWVYVLQSMNDRERYIGSTSTLRQRLAQHHDGKVLATKGRRPLKLIYAEGCVAADDAKRREHYLKTTGGRRFPAKRLKVYYQP